MKANLIYLNRSIVVDIDDTLANLSMLTDSMTPNDSNFNTWHKAYQHIEKCYLDIAKVLISPSINQCAFIVDSDLNISGDDIIDNVHFYTIE